MQEYKIIYTEVVSIEVYFQAPAGLSAGDAWQASQDDPKRSDQSVTVSEREVDSLIVIGRIGTTGVKTRHPEPESEIFSSRKGAELVKCTETDTLRWHPSLREYRITRNELSELRTARGYETLGSAMRQWNIDRSEVYPCCPTYESCPKCEETDRPS